MHIKYKLRGVVLAPNIKGDSYKVQLDTGSSYVMMIRGNEAINLLGGLGQIHRWFE